MQTRWPRCWEVALDQQRRLRRGRDHKEVDEADRLKDGVHFVGTVGPESEHGQLEI